MDKLYDFVFVVLVYRNTKDLEEFFQSLNLSNTKVVVVNSFFDEESENQFKYIAESYAADFISVPNKGYGAGNNAGVKYASEHYTFRYLIISNADVMIEKMRISDLDKWSDSIIAPCIINLSGKKQNPNNPFPKSKFLTWCTYIVYRDNHRKLIWALYAIARFRKIVYYCISRFRRQIFSAHGAFVIIPAVSLLKLGTLYNEDMFLFNEEAHLAMLAKSKGVKTVYVPDIVVRHKEDGSMSVANVNLFERERQSYMVYYEYWFMNTHTSY